MASCYSDRKCSGCLPVNWSGETCWSENTTALLQRVQVDCLGCSLTAAAAIQPHQRLCTTEQFLFLTTWDVISLCAPSAIFFSRWWCERSRAAQIDPQPPGGRQRLSQRFGMLHPIRVFGQQEGRRRSGFLMQRQKSLHCVKCAVVNCVKQQL